MLGRGMTDKPSDGTTAVGTLAPGLARPVAAIRDALALIERTAEDPASVRQYTQLASRLLADLERAIAEQDRAHAGRAHSEAGRRRNVAPTGPRIVIVDDADDMREAMHVLLETAGYEVFTASNGADGVNRILELHPPVAFVDLGLPDLDGYEVARQVRARAPASTYLVAMSGYGGFDANERARAAGFDRRLTKPLSMADIRAAIAGQHPHRVPRR
jgi:CheY-like chemotaxis protein